ncbi:MAG: hypothetical protein NTZ33_14335 [Bacteroidetes bacterium]|nr:hypothetical protein [Bacteroidota bacterium]
MADLQKEGYTLCKSIISQRLMLIRFDKSKMYDTDNVRTEAENLKLEFDKYNSNPRSLAYFIKTNYFRLVSLITKNSAYQNRLNRLYELYNQSLTIA